MFKLLLSIARSAGRDVHRQRAVCAAVVVSFTVILAGASASAHADAYGPSQLANTFTSGRQAPTGLFRCGNGDTVAMWYDTPRAALYERGFNRGIPTQRAETPVGAASNPGGMSCFGLVSSLPDGSGYGAFVTLYDAAGNVTIPQFRVNDTTAGDQVADHVAVNASGRFAVAWYDWGRRGTYVRAYSPSGTPLTGEQLVAASPSNGLAQDSDLIMDPQGGFIVAYSLQNSSNKRDVYLRRFSSTGFALGPAQKVNTSVGDHIITQLAMTGNSIVATWLVGTGSPVVFRFLGQRFDLAGNKVGPEFQVNVDPVPAGAPFVAASSGGFTITWTDKNTPSGVYRALARSYLADGTPQGPPFMLHPESTLHSAGSWITMDADGNATMLWQQTDPVSGDADPVVGRYQPIGVVVQPISVGIPVSGLSGAAGSWQYFKFTVPPGQTVVDVSLAGTGDADLYVRYGELPSLTRWDGRPFIDGSNETRRDGGFSGG